MKQRPIRAFNGGGFSLIEAVVFIVVAGVLLAGLLVAITTPLKTSPQAGQIDLATEIAQQRMELILAQRRVSGFAAFTDPCPGPAVCTPPTGYVVTVGIAGNWLGNTNYKVITVDVSGTSAVTATALVANY